MNLIIALLIFLVLIVMLLIFTFFSPKLISMMVRKMFEKSPARRPENYSEILKKVKVIKDIKYASRFKNNDLDLFMPKENNKKTPTIIWIHGGAFVGGDKNDCEIFSTVIASNNYNVININYERAPEQKYPSPIYQFIEVYEWIVRNSETYNIDLNKLVLAGDSAGAYIAMQIALLIFNDAYKKKTGINIPVKHRQIKSVLLYCGPYDVTKISESENKIFAYMMKQTGWAYFGDKNWNQKFRELDIIENINEKIKLPPIFVTDGNTNSFLEHAKKLVNRLIDNNIITESYFLNIEDCITQHEYQFVLDTEPARIAMEKTLEFLKKYL